MTLGPQEPSAAALQAFLETALPDRSGTEVTGFHEISSGWESDVYAFDLRSDAQQGSEPEALVLRVYPGVDALEKSEREFKALRRLHRTGYPVPEVLLLVQAPSPFGRPFLIMERAPGHGMWHETFNGPEARQRARFQLFCQLFVALHRIDWRRLVDKGDISFESDPYVFVDRFLALFRTYIERFQQPGYEPVLAWLAARRDAVPCDRPTGIHWDFHPENILLAEDGSVTVIDWTGFEVSDPRFDLAWTMTLVGSQEGEGVRRRILEAYASIAGHQIEEIAFFEVVAAARRLASVTISLAAGAEQLGMRQGAETMMLRHRGPLSKVYARLQTLTGIRVPEVDQLLQGVSV